MSLCRRPSRNRTSGSRHLTSARGLPSVPGSGQILTSAILYTYILHVSVAFVGTAPDAHGWTLHADHGWPTSTPRALSRNLRGARPRDVTKTSRPVAD